jgi:hypothetical protein
LLLFSPVDLDLLEYLRLEPVLPAWLLFNEARVTLDLWVELVTDINYREVRFVELFDPLFLVLVESREAVIVAECIVDSVPPHPANHQLVLLRQVFLKFISGDPAADRDRRRPRVLQREVLYALLVVFLHDHPGNVGLVRLDWLHALRFLSELVQLREGASEFLAL